MAKPVSKGYVSHPRLSHVFPTAECLALAESIGLGMPRARQASLKALAEAAVTDPNLFRPFGTIEEAIARLRAIRGVGEWTAQYIALRALREMDAFPASDIGLLRGAAMIEGARPTSARLLQSRRIMASVARLRRAAPLGRRRHVISTDGSSAWVRSCSC